MGKFLPAFLLLISSQTSAFSAAVTQVVASRQVVYEEAVMEMGAKGYWRLGEDAGTTMTDYALGRDGTYINTPTLETEGLLTGNGDTAVTFLRSASEHAHGVDNDDFDGGTNFTWTFWYKSTNANAEWEHFLTKIQAYCDDGWYIAKVQTSGNIRWYRCNGGGASSYVAASVNAGDGVRHFISGVNTGNQVEIFFDGASVVGPSALTNPITNTDPLDFGVRASGDDSYPLDGVLDDVTVATNAWTAAQMEMLNMLGRGEYVSPGDSW